MISKSKPLEKKDAVRAMDGNLADQKTDSVSIKHTPEGPKTQYNAFKIVIAKGVVFTESIKNTLKQKHECRFSDCYGTFISPIAKKHEVQDFLSKFGIKAELLDVFADLEKNRKIDGLESRLSILDREIYTLFNEFITRTHEYDPRRSYHDFEVEPLPYDENQPNDDIRFRFESDFYAIFLKLKNLEEERGNFRISINLHVQEEIGKFNSVFR